MLEFMNPSIAVLPNRHKENQAKILICSLFMHFESLFCQYLLYLSKFENLISHCKMKITVLLF